MLNTHKHHMSSKLTYLNNTKQQRKHLKLYYSYIDRQRITKCFAHITVSTIEQTGALRVP